MSKLCKKTNKKQSFTPNHHQQTVQRWGKDHFLGVMFPHPLSNQCVITTHVIIAIIVVIIAIVIISSIIIVIISIISNIIIMQQC